MLRTSTRTILLLTAALLAGSASSTVAEMAAPAASAKMASGDSSPSGEKHPGDIVFDDKIEKRTYTRRAAQVVFSSAWAKVGDAWKAVVRVEITGTPEKKTLTRYGADGKVLEVKEVLPTPPSGRPLPPT